jgi:protein-L-isoaspartate(D-aspartate) O-methyltransferase
MNTTIDTHPDDLRAILADRLVAEGEITGATIQKAFRTVSRHLFLPGVPLEDAYADQVVVTKRSPSGEPLISASQPTIIATMLEQIDVQPGHHILEIGTGTGYNAALLRELARTGQVTTVDIAPEATRTARQHLVNAGYPDIEVLTGDGAAGAPERAPFDRIIVTAGAWDLPPAWWQQLTPTGRIVVPLRWRGLTRSIAFDHTENRLTSRTIKTCGFILMQGKDGEQTIDLPPNVTLTYDEDQTIDPDTLRNVLDQPPHETGSGVLVGGYDPFDGIWLRMATTEPGTCRITAQPAAIRTGRVTPAIAKLNPALVEPGSLAYLTSKRQSINPAQWELGAIGHGPKGADLADRIVHQIHQWNGDRAATPTIEAFPMATSDGQLRTAHTINKRHTCLVSRM